MPHGIHIFDLHRMFVGDLPWTFTLEIVFRTTFLYLYALVLVRLIGKRGLRELAVFEYVIIFALGSAVGDPMFYPDIPLLHGMTVLTTIVALQRMLARILQMSEPLHDFVYPGKPARLVFDGRVDLAALKRERLRNEDLFMLLREAGVENLGQVKRAYLEPTGELSTWLFTPAEARPGLPLTPDPGADGLAVLSAGSVVPHDGDFACGGCAHTVSMNAGTLSRRCPQCQHDQWLPVSLAGAGRRSRAGGPA
jgi:uncharacterized membrane protein YcaP (DUF421 family)